VEAVLADGSWERLRREKEGKKSSSSTIKAAPPEKPEPELFLREPKPY